MGDQGTEEKFGCEPCWPSAAGTAWEAQRALTHVADLLDESHFRVMILACPHCSQRFVSIFTETIDWADGDDPQYWTRIPITGEEAADLSNRKDALKETDLNAMGSGRRSLRRDYPKGVKRKIYWGSGIHIGMHD